MNTQNPPPAATPEEVAAFNADLARLRMQIGGTNPPEVGKAEYPTKVIPEREVLPPHGTAAPPNTHVVTEAVQATTVAPAAAARTVTHPEALQAHGTATFEPDAPRRLHLHMDPPPPTVAAFDRYGWDGLKTSMKAIMEACLREGISFDHLLTASRSEHEEALAEVLAVQNAVSSRAAPQWAWEIIEETLTLDGRSLSFDRATRLDIRIAMRAMIVASEDGHDTLSRNEVLAEMLEEEEGA